MKNIDYKIVFVFSILISVFTNTGRANTIIVESTAPNLIGESIKVYNDPMNMADYSVVMTQLDEFENWTKKVFIEYATTSKYWVFFSVKNLSGTDLWIDINNSNMTEIDMYRFNENLNLIDSIKTGCISPDPNLPRNGYTFQLPVVDEDSTGTRHILLGLKTNLIYEVPIFMGSLNEILRNRGEYDYVGVFFIGGIVLLFLFNFTLFFLTKDSIYLYYCLYLFCAVITGTYLNNFPFFENIVGTTIAHHYLDLWLWTLFFGTGLFTIRYFDLKKTDRTFYWVIVIHIMIFVFAGLLNLIIPLSLIANTYQAIAAVFYLSCLGFSYRLMIRGNKDAKLYCAGWTFMMMGAIIYLLVYNGLFPYNIITRNVTYIGTTIEIIIFSIALGRRINDLKEEQIVLNKALKKLNDSLVSTNESLDSFNYHVSHDLKTAMNNTLALSMMAKKYNKKNDPERVNEVIEKLEQVAKNGTETVQSFLSLGKIDNLLKQERNELVNIEIALEELIEQHDLTEKINIVIDENQLSIIRMHPKAFESIFLNFLTNSIKYSDGKPTAKLQFIDHVTYISMIYSDNGIGIDLDRFGKELFRPFRRATDKNNVEGTGVGLYLVKRIVNGYGGNIQVKSGLGKGATFTIEIPLGQNED